MNLTQAVTVTMRTEDICIIRMQGKSQMNNGSTWPIFASVFIARMALGWNIYRDLKRPRLKVTFGFRQLIDIEGKEELPFLMLFYIDLGPGKINIDFIILKKRWAQIKTMLNEEGAYSLIVSQEKYPLSYPLPTTLNVGEKEILLS